MTKENSKDRIQKEKDFYNIRFGKETRESLDKYYSINQLINYYYHNKLFIASRDKKVLEYGCGLGSQSFELVEIAREVCAIDISEVAIAKAEKIASEKNITNISFKVMNAEVLDFPDNKFDVICGVSILHHLDLYAAYSELSRVLIPSSKAYFIEQLGHNPIINLFRRFTSDLRIEDEHPLRAQDIELCKKYFDVVNIKYYYLFSLFAVPFRNKKYFMGLLNFLNSIDQKLFKLKFIRLQAWQVVMEISNPRKGN